MPGLQNRIEPLCRKEPEKVAKLKKTNNKNQPCLTGTHLM